jgi:hypothetical protein
MTSMARRVRTNPVGAIRAGCRRDPEMYTSTEDARSDLMLAGAVFLFGGIIFQIVLRIIPLGQVPVLGELLLIAQPVITTALVPFLLIRYRQEPWSMYGLGGGVQGLAPGVALALPIVAATLIVPVVLGASPLAALPVTVTGGSEAVALVARLLQFASLAFFAIYGTVKARDAFRGEYKTVRDGALEVLRILGIVVAAGAALTLLTVLGQIDVRGLLAFLLPAAGVGGTVWLMWRSLSGPSSTVRPVLVAPTVIFGLAAFRIQLQPGALAETVYQAGLLACVGLVVGLLSEQRRSGWPAIGLALTIAALSTFGRIIR